MIRTVDEAEGLKNNYTSSEKLHFILRDIYEKNVPDGECPPLNLFMGVLSHDSNAIEDIKTVFGHPVSVNPYASDPYASNPYTTPKTQDALLTAAEVATKIKTIHPSSGDKAVVSTGIFNSGTASNIIPEIAVIEGVIRTLGPDDRNEMEGKFKAVIDEVCSKYGSSAEIDLRKSHGGVVNTDAETALMERSAREVLGDKSVIVLDEPTMVTEDFGYFVDATSGCFCHIGAGCS